MARGYGSQVDGPGGEHWAGLGGQRPAQLRGLEVACLPEGHSRSELCEDSSSQT